jgi:hypothetical protein
MARDGVAQTRPSHGAAVTIAELAYRTYQENKFAAARADGIITKAPEIRKPRN